ncbi:hypothetical protein HPB49_018546 [Dermacentor silvarum]|uniref:Uncharacterized protein n=1 Tax=Dermacentor silvarum TaxID=543639 RepID=A0ACB8E268_DERSI|nr:hypothetical protein HPB49_018546 [Dermacentor silvarum]
MEKAFSEVSVLDSIILFPIQTKPGKQNYTQNKGVQNRISSAWWYGRLRLVGDSVSAAAAFDQSQPPWITPESTMGDLHAASNPIWNFFVKIPPGTKARCLKCKAVLKTPTSTTTLATHLRRHPDLHKDYQEKRNARERPSKLKGASKASV